MPSFLTLVGFKEYLQIDWTDDDTALTGLLDAAEGYLADPENGILGRPVAVTAFSETFDSLSDVRLRFPDGATVTSVTYTDTDDAEQPLGAIYGLDGGGLTLNPGETWPTHKAPVVVGYDAGFETIPPQIITAGYFYAASIFEQRDSEKMRPQMLREVMALMVGGYRRIGI